MDLKLSVEGSNKFTLWVNFTCTATCFIKIICLKVGDDDPGMFLVSPGFIFLPNWMGTWARGISSHHWCWISLVLWWYTDSISRWHFLDKTITMGRITWDREMRRDEMDEKEKREGMTGRQGKRRGRGVEGRWEEGGDGEGRRDKEMRADSLARIDPCCLAGSASANPNGTWNWD